GLPTGGVSVEVLRDTVRALHTEPVPGMPPLTGGMVGFIGWECVRHWEKLPNPPADDLNLPELSMNLVADMAAHDAAEGTVTLIANAINFNGSDENMDQAYDSAVTRLQAMLDQLAVPVDSAAAVLTGTDVDRGTLMDAVTHSWDENEYLAALAKSKTAIVDGEVFQIVVSRRFELETKADALDVYRVLRATNPSPYMYLFNFENEDGETFEIFRTSPEALLTVNDAHGVTRPTAGSRARGANYEDDQLHEKSLVNDAKERAQHLMLVDLSRNDLSKVCQAGTVEVTQF